MFSSGRRPFYRFTLDDLDELGGLPPHPPFSSYIQILLSRLFGRLDSHLRQKADRKKEMWGVNVGWSWVFIFCRAANLLTLLVAGGGFESTDLWVMSPTSYQTAPPRHYHSTASQPERSNPSLCVCYSTMVVTELSNPMKLAHERVEHINVLLALGPRALYH